MSTFKTFFKPFDVMMLTSRYWRRVKTGSKVTLVDYTVISLLATLFVNSEITFKMLGMLWFHLVLWTKNLTEDKKRSGLLDNLTDVSLVNIHYGILYIYFLCHNMFNNLSVYLTFIKSLVCWVCENHNVHNISIISVCDSTPAPN